MHKYKEKNTHKFCNVEIVKSAGISPVKARVFKLISTITPSLHMIPYQLLVQGSPTSQSVPRLGTLRAVYKFTNAVTSSGATSQIDIPQNKKTKKKASFIWGRNKMFWHCHEFTFYTDQLSTVDLVRVVKGKNWRNSHNV